MNKIESNQKFNLGEHAGSPSLRSITKSAYYQSINHQEIQLHPHQVHLSLKPVNL